MALIPTEPKQRVALMVILASLAGMYFFYEHWYSPQTEQIVSMEVRLQQLQDQNRRAQILAARGGNELEERLAVYERHIQRLEALIPQTEEVPALLNAMALEARRHGVELGSMRPEPAQQGPFYTMQSYELTVVGDYHDVGRFLTSVASLPRIITPVDLEIAPNAGPAVVEGARFPVQARFRVETYVAPGGTRLPQGFPGGAVDG